VETKFLLSMKELIIQIIKEELQKEARICFAYLFGSFLKGNKNRDIDIGIYLSSSDVNLFEITSELKDKISRRLQKIEVKYNSDDIDITILNLVAFHFLTRIFCQGFLLLDREPDIRKSLMEKNSIKYRECVGLLKEAKLL